MPLDGLPQRVRELGRIRMGEKGTKTKPDGKVVTYPVKRTTWRFTSQSAELLAAVAEQYGGEVEDWPDAPGEGRFYQVGTDAEAIDVLIPVAYSLSQYYEFWTADGCTRRCDGITNTIDDTPCVCPHDISARMEAASGLRPTACKPTTRLNVLLPDIPDLGFWRMECHGYQGAIELPGALALYVGLARQHAGAGDVDGLIVRAQLAIEPRRSKKPGKPPADYIVPVIRTPNLSPAMLMSGQSAPMTLGGPPTAQLEPGGAAPALDAGSGREEVATTASPAPPPFDESNVKLVDERAWRKFVDACRENGLDMAGLCKEASGGHASHPRHIRAGEQWNDLLNRFAAAQQKARAS